MSKDTAAIRDQLGNDPDNFQVLNSDYDESLGLEEGPTKISTETLGNSWIVGSSTNGLVGTNTATEGGGQQVVGASARVITVQRVVNPNRVFHEHFRDTTFRTSPTTANWDTTNFRLSMDDSASHVTPRVKVATFSAISLTNGTVFKATPSWTETIWGEDTIRCFIRTETTNDWEEFTNGEESIFTNTGDEIQIRFVFTGNGGTSTYIEDLDVALS